LARYEVVVNNRKFQVEVKEISHNKFRVNVNGNEEVIEIFEEGKARIEGKKTVEAGELKKGGEIKAEMSGSIVKLLVNEGDVVKRGQPVLILEAMKMENEIVSPFDGVVESLNVKEGDKVQVGDLLLIVREQEISKSKRKTETENSISDNGKIIRAEMAGTIVRILKNEGEAVKSGDVVLILEAMKMENEIPSPSDGILSKIFVKEGDRVQIGDPLFSIS